jgi:capsule polysaccharide modification protein KpsS
MLPDPRGKNVLLLQGPVGPFFRRFAAELRDRGATVTKVNFNAGDALFYPTGAVAYRGDLAGGPAALRGIVRAHRIDTIYLFGDQRPIHREAVKVAAELGVPVWVFEEGYLRPDWVTVEPGGVNGNSRMPKDPDFYRMAAPPADELPVPIPVGNTFGRMAWCAVACAIATTFFSFAYPGYRHHRDVNCFRQAYLWCRGALRKLVYAAREQRWLGELAGPLSGRYFFVPLQVHCDAQLRHSPYRAIEELVEEVVATFAAHAPPGALLVVKHHPHDRPYTDYADFLRELGARHGLGDRLIYVHDLHLPTLLKNARGVVTMNSTVGTSALYHGTPVKVLGRAVYDIPGLTYPGSLAAFFAAPGEVDAALLDCFSRWLRGANQINGSFYKRARALGTVSGLDAAAFAAPTEGGAGAGIGSGVERSAR